MSYTTQDRYGDMVHKYVPPKKGELSGAPATWWPDYGSSTRDFSFQENCGPTAHLFKSRVQQHKSASRLEPLDCSEQPMHGRQFRHPAPAREAILREVDAPPESKIRAHAATEKQGHLRRLEHRQRKMDSWLDNAPIQVGDSVARSRSENSLSSLQASDASTGVYSRYGFLPDRGINGDKPPSMRSGLSLTAPPSEPGPRAKRGGAKKPRKTWRACPESRYTLDPVTFLPILKEAALVLEDAPLTSTLPRASRARSSGSAEASGFSSGVCSDGGGRGSSIGSRCSAAAETPSRDTP